MSVIVVSAGESVLCDALFLAYVFNLVDCWCRIGFVLLNKRVHAALASANRVAVSDIIFNYWGSTLDIHRKVLFELRTCHQKAGASR